MEESIVKHWKKILWIQEPATFKLNGKALCFFVSCQLKINER